VRPARGPRHHQPLLADRQLDLVERRGRQRRAGGVADVEAVPARLDIEDDLDVVDRVHEDEPAVGRVVAAVRRRRRRTRGAAARDDRRGRGDGRVGGGRPAVGRARGEREQRGDGEGAAQRSDRRHEGLLLG
jgi:hypothetical protein